MKQSVLLFGSILAATLGVNAQAFEFGKPIPTNVLITKNNPQATLTASAPKKQVMLMNIKLSAKEKQRLLSYKPKANKKMTGLDSLPPSVQLGMNYTPVLDQGPHGSCVTFAITGAIDAVIGQGDYVSQLCSLSLATYLEDKSYIPSGWNGSIGPWVLDQVMRFGVVSKDAQREHGCGGMTEYPVDSLSISEGMTAEDYSKISANVNNKIYPVPRMNFAQRFDAHFQDWDVVNTVLYQVKSSLAKGYRVTFGTFLVLSPYCSAGACATYHSSHDTWALTREIDTPPYEMGGHEMIITGYDDNAVAVDAAGVQHKGLLTLRNSWSDEVGDHGDYYMTYDYFRKFAGEVQEMYVTDVVL